MLSGSMYRLQLYMNSSFSSGPAAAKLAAADGAADAAAPMPRPTAAALGAALVVPTAGAGREGRGGARQAGSRQEAASIDLGLRHPSQHRVEIPFSHVCPPPIRVSGCAVRT